YRFVSLCPPEAPPPSPKLKYIYIYKRMQKRRHLETSFQQTDPGCSSDAQPHAFLLRTSSATSSPLKKEQPLFTLRQVGMICERLLKEREEKVREEYEEILNTKLAEQYDAFVKFTHDQIMRRYGEHYDDHPYISLLSPSQEVPV
uniref:Akirin-2 n=1 Tax=Spermophilus dauricus TaxID=99837 RepID=A0A8C9UJB6_SPEDA